MRFIDQNVLDQLITQEACSPEKSVSRGLLIALAAMLALMALATLFTAKPSVRTMSDPRPAAPVSGFADTNGSSRAP